MRAVVQRVQEAAVRVDGVTVGEISYADKNSTGTDKSVVRLLGKLSGATGNNRGGKFVVQVKTNGANTETDVLQVTVDAVSVTPLLTTSSHIVSGGDVSGDVLYGTSLTLDDNANVENMLAIGNITVPASQTELAYRHANNNILAYGNIDASGNITGTSYNVVTASAPFKTSTGTYQIILSQAISTSISVVMVTLYGAGTLGTVSGYASSSTHIDVVTGTVNGSSLVVSADRAFSFLVVGRPSTAPTY